LGAYASVIATAMAQLRNGYISCIVNKNDPYSAIRLLSFMLAILPEDARPVTKDPPRPDDKDDEEKECSCIQHDQEHIRCGDECQCRLKAELGSFLSDPDNTKSSNAIWNYVAEMGYNTEEAVSKYIYGQMNRLRS